MAYLEVNVVGLDTGRITVVGGTPSSEGGLRVGELSGRNYSTQSFSLPATNPNAYLDLEPSHPVGTRLPRITSGRASRGCSFCRMRLKTTLCPSLESWV